MLQVFQRLSGRVGVVPCGTRTCHRWLSSEVVSAAPKRSSSIPINTGAAKGAWSSLPPHVRSSQSAKRMARPSNADPLTTPANRYEIGKVIGGGRYGVVKAATDTTDGSRVAIKILRKSDHVPVIRTELQAHRYMKKVIGSHPGLSIASEVFEDAKHVYIAMEYIAGGDLFDRIISKGPFQESEIVTFLNSLVPIIQLLHKNGIIHRDIKPENVLFRTIGLEEGASKVSQPVLSDFGLCRIDGHTDSVVAPAGTFGYAAPEVLKADVGHDSSCDVWSLGVLVYAAIAGELPFPASMDGNTTVEGHLDEVLAGPKFDEEQWKTISPEGIELIEQMLHFNSYSRPSLSVIINHPWLKQA